MCFIIQRIFPLKVSAISGLQSKHVNVILFQVIVLLSTKNVRHMGFNLLNPHPYRNALLLVVQEIVNTLKCSLKILESIDGKQAWFWGPSNITCIGVEKQVIWTQRRREIHVKSYRRKSHFQNGREKTSENLLLHKSNEIVKVVQTLAINQWLPTIWSVIIQEQWSKFWPELWPF